MGGIWCSITTGCQPLLPSESDLEKISARGPDGVSTISFTLPLDGVDPKAGDDSKFVSLTFCASVSSLRGDPVLPQPLTSEIPLTSRDRSRDDGKFVFCWNGEMWKYRDIGLADGLNDTDFVFKLLMSRLRGVPREDGPDDYPSASSSALLKVFKEISGPYAFIFFDPISRYLYFARDCLGRRSLVLKQTPDSVVISSVTSGEVDHPDATSRSPKWSELDAHGVYILSLNRSTSHEPDGQNMLDDTTTPVGPIFRFPYHHRSKTSGHSEGIFLSTFGDFNTSISLTPAPLTSESTPVREVEDLLRDSVRVRLPSRQDIVYWDKRGTEPPSADTSIPRAHLGILFSGGLDCSLLARLCNDIYRPREPIDLLNVAFESPRLVKKQLRDNKVGENETQSCYDLCPDRATARQGFAELQAVCLGREWRLIEINVPYELYCEHRPVIKSLIYPHHTEMDLSIGAALYFASRGAGVINQPPSRSTITPGLLYRSQARVLLSGLGADELFGGYRRHEVAFSRGGYPALMNELAIDFSRLGYRNLGRDDRVTSHWGREVRYPFLDEDLVSWALKAPVDVKCPFGDHEADDRSASGAASPSEASDLAPQGQPSSSVEPGKRLLRLLALSLNLPRAAGEKKRAIQFGARTAKMEVGSGKVSGVDKIS